MAAINAGDLKSIVYAGRTFEQKATEDFNYEVGGMTAVDDKNLVGNAGTKIIQLNVTCWECDTVILEQRGDIDFLKEKVRLGIEESLIVTLNNGEVRAGKGIPVGDIVANSQTGTMPFKIQGSGKFELI